MRYIEIKLNSAIKPLAAGYMSVQARRKKCIFPVLNIIDQITAINRYGNTGDKT